MFQNKLQISFCLSLILLSAQVGISQKITISGTVYDITKKTPIEFVSVVSTSGKGTVTDSLGQYNLTVNETDSIYFSFLNKPTPKYFVKNIQNPGSFDISILRKVKELPEVFVKQRNYHLDSLQNRLDYQKIFDYRKPGFKTSINPYEANAPVGLDLDEFINMFKFKKNKRMLAFQRRLEQDEKEKYIDHRFNKGLVKKLTGLNAPEIDSFMNEYRPTFEMTTQFNDLEFGQFIVEAFKYYKAGIKVNKQAFTRTQE
ncbi:carboxypeptidase-like regulatory domain-containing protein [Segetibacter koreensis]|uniref:carboxypeptidase-like regulatory domain-containing protein n=1 Tax=Segetibacter koreensis TaxID=398037 RepID=UPI00037C6061|nr:carboxypeptidase-like regulatory domain-containing protein [Segetibacter koreensis]